MLRAEQKILEWVEKHILLIAAVGVSVIGIYIRWSLRDFVSKDSAESLLPWYDDIKNIGGIHGLSRQVGNYNMLYQFLIAVMTYIPVKSLYAYKLLSGLFDYLLAMAAGVLVKMLTEKKADGVCAYMLVIMSPIVFLNSAAWAQCDAIYTCFVITSVIALLREKYPVAFVLLGIAFSFKLQAVFILPFFLFYYMVKKKFSVLYFAIVPVMMVVTSLPCVFMGRDFTDIFKIYMIQANTYQKMSMNYPGVWVIFNDGTMMESYEFMKSAAIAVAVVILGMFMMGWIRKKVAWNGKNMVYIAFLLCYTCVLFLPAMHERYGYCYEILALVIAVVNRKTIALCVPLYSLTLVTYGYFLFDRPVNMNLLSAINLAVYTIYALLLCREMSGAGKEVENEDESYR